MFPGNGVRPAVRAFAGIGALAVLAALQPPPAQAQTMFANLGDPPPNIAAANPKKSSSAERGTVSLRGYSPGTIVVKTRETRLYYVIGDGKAVRYPVGVGRPDKHWTGHSAISGKYIKPAWSPPEELRRDKPRLPHVIPSGASNNPMGAAALTIAGGEYAIHGTNRPGSVGGFVSYG